MIEETVWKLSFVELNQSEEEALLDEVNEFLIPEIKTLKSL